MNAETDINRLEITEQHTSNDIQDIRSRFQWRRHHSNKIDLESCFSSSSDGQQEEDDPHLNLFDQSVEQPKFTPLYRKQHDGILIYDIDAIIPNQPLSKCDKVKFTNTVNNRQLRLKEFLQKAGKVFESNYIDIKIPQDYNLNFTKYRRFDNNGKGLYKLVLPPEEEMPIRFESRFENGNLK